MKATIEDLRAYLIKKMGRCIFSEKELTNCLDLSVRRGNETKSEILKDAFEFLYA